jgi:hypothetical protein
MVTVLIDVPPQTFTPQVDIRPDMRSGQERLIAHRFSKLMGNMKLSIFVSYRGQLLSCERRQFF